MDLTSRKNGQECGEIQIIFGPMFSGKTTELIRRCQRYRCANYRCLVVKYANDRRYDAEAAVSTHDRSQLPAVPAVRLSDVATLLANVDVVGVDEAQFFPDILSVAEQLSNSGKIVIIAALDATYQRVAFPDVVQLVPKAESVVKLKAVCMKCYGDASFTKRKGSSTQLELIGGAEAYMAVCRSCYFVDEEEERTTADVAADQKAVAPVLVLGERNIVA